MLISLEFRGIYGGFVRWMMDAGYFILDAEYWMV
jgi:hypothetical protein